MPFAEDDLQQFSQNDPDLKEEAGLEEENEVDKEPHYPKGSLVVTICGPTDK